MFSIPQAADGKWGSYISKYPADSGKLPMNAFSKDTRNLITSASGQAEKRPGGTIWNPLSLLSGPALDQYEGIFDSGVRLLIVNDAGTLKASTGNGLFQSISAGYANPANFEFASYQNRVYGDNGIDAPIVIDTATSYGGVTYSFTTAHVMPAGATAPVTAPTAVRAVDSTANQIPAGSHTYKVTFVYYNGTEESNGGPASGVVVNDATHTSTNLTAIPIGGYGVTARNIYRDNNDGNWLLLDFIANNTATTYLDKLPIGATPTPIPTQNALPPIFKYVALYLDRLFVIDITGKTIAWSDAGEPDVFEPQNFIAGPQDDVMTAIYIYNGIPWVFGQHTVGTILGTTDGTFFYSPVSTTVGCVDNRSIQTRSIISVPTMLWLSALPNKGIYFTNGSTVQYLSDFIEDLTFNLAQISYLQRQNTQNSQTAFQGGVSSSSIDLLSNPGTIETINPVSRFSHAADWAAGVITDLALIGDELVAPTLFNPTLATGSLTGAAIISGSTVTLPQTSDFTGESTSGILKVYGSGGGSDSGPGGGTAYSIIPTRTGTIDVVTLYAFRPGGLDGTATFHIWTDSFGLPGASIYSVGVTTPYGSGLGGTVSVTPGVSLTAGVTYWIGLNSFSGTTSLINCKFSGNAIVGFNGANWELNPAESSLSTAVHGSSYTFTPTPISSSGTWTSPVNDTGSVYLSGTGFSLVVTGTYPVHTAISVQIQGSTDQSSWVTTDTLSNPTGTTALTGGPYRYWRVVYSISTTDNRFVPTISAFTLFYKGSGTWISAPILMTTDITSLVSLVINAITPSGTTALIQIATSASSGSGYSSFTSIGLATPNTYAKLKVTLTTDSGNTVSPALISTELDWAVSGNLVSSIIDTGTSPSGWGLFQFSRVGTTGTVQFYFRSATTSGGIPAATFVAVANGSYPTSAPHEFAQWKVVMTATVDNVPEVNSVTVNWLLTNGTNVRAASLFFNKSYYLAVALQGSTFNNLLIELDYEGNWRIHSGENIGTLGTYFNDAFYGDSVLGRILNAFNLPTDNGTPIMFDLRTKCVVYGDDDHYGIVRSLRVKGVNTGTTIHAYYSPDFGLNWYEMLNSSGVVGYTTPNTMTVFDEYFIPVFDGSVPVSGIGFIYRVTSSDAFPCTIRKLQPMAYVRQGKYIAEATA